LGSPDKECIKSLGSGDLARRAIEDSLSAYLRDRFLDVYPDCIVEHMASDAEYLSELGERLRVIANGYRVVAATLREAFSNVRE